MNNAILGAGFVLATFLPLAVCQDCIKVQRAVGCSNIGIFGCKDELSEIQESNPDLQRAAPSGRSRSRYHEGQEQPWTAQVDDCVVAGGERTECIEALPPELLAELEAWEARNGALRRAQVTQRAALGQPTIGFRRATAQHRHQAVVLLEPERFQVVVPEPIDEPFLLQLFELDVLETGEIKRHMRAASEIHERAAENAIFEMCRPYGDAFYFHAKDFRDRFYLRVVLTNSLTYRDFKPTLFDYRSNGNVIIEGYVRDQEIFSSYVTDGYRPISRSKPFTIRIVREESPGYVTDRDYSSNLGFVEGVPLSFSQRLKLDAPLGWNYRIDGIYFTASGAERYNFRQYVGNKIGGIGASIGFHGVTIARLRENYFHIDEVSHAGD